MRRHILLHNMQNRSMKSTSHPKYFFYKLHHEKTCFCKKRKQRHGLTVQFPPHCSTLLFLFNKLCSVLLSRLVFCGCTSRQLGGNPKTRFLMSPLNNHYGKSIAHDFVFQTKSYMKCFQCMIFTVHIFYPSPRSSLYLRKITQYG